MLGRVVVENGVKKIVPLTADCGSGNPVGTVIAVYSNKVPNGYLPCNGVAFDTAQFPVLYALLQDDHTPDLRECTLKGIGESGRTVGAHVKAGGLAVGEFIDDRVQNHKHSGIDWDGSSQVTSFSTGTQPLSGSGNMSTGRYGATTEVKAVGVNWCIKATSGINENQADNVLSALSPVDTVAVNNMRSVTSNAVAQKINSLDVASVGGTGKYISAISETDGVISATATDLGNMVPVNSVTSGNMHSVTSNAVYNATKFCINSSGLVSVSNSSWQATSNVFINYLAILTSGSRPLEVNNVTVSSTDTLTGNNGIVYYINSFSGIIKKGDTISCEYLSNSTVCRIFTLQN